MISAYNPRAPETRLKEDIVMRSKVFAILLVSLALTACDTESEAPASSQPMIPSEDYKEAMALMMNANNFLCAKVVDIRPLSVGEKMSEVECITYRGGDARKTYIYDGKTGMAMEQ